jgi:6,7-dimethyl-8-ribityllumazine synthase
MSVDGSGLRVAIIAGNWHQHIIEGLIAGAEQTLLDAGTEQVLFRVGGAFELPVAAQAALDSGYDAVVCLGVIIRGGTPHFEYVSGAVTEGLTRVALDAGKPVGFGILTVDTEQQALDRSGLPGSHESKGQEAAEAAVQAATLIRTIRSSSSHRGA